MKIYDLRGNVVVGATRWVAQQGAASSAPTNRTFIWTPAQTIASGIYLVRARIADEQQITKRIVYVR